MAEIVERIVSKYYKALEDGKVLGRKCPECGAVEWPPVYACNTCGCMDTEWCEMSGEGELTSLLVPTVMSARPQHQVLEPFGYSAVKCKEGALKNVMVLGVTRKNADYIREHMPYPAHMQIVDLEGYTTCIFAIDPIDENGNPIDMPVKGRRIGEAKVKTEAVCEEKPFEAEPVSAEEVDLADLDMDVFNKLAQIVAESYGVEVEKVTPETAFEGEFKAASVVFVGLVAKIENEFDVFMTITDASACETVGRLAMKIAKEMDE